MTSALRVIVFGALVLVWGAAYLGCRGEPLPVQGDPCQSLEQCAGTQGLSCSQGICTSIACQRSLECPAEAACVEGACGVAECLADSDCAQGAECFEGDCRDDLCSSKADCQASQVCAGTPSVCAAPPSTCSGDEECPGTTRCKFPEGVCVEPCTQGSCPEGFYCNVMFCSALCADISSCGLGEVCSQGRCQLRRDCSNQPGCPLDTPLRDTADCTCVECLEDSDCDPTRLEACVAGQCSFCAERASTDQECEVSGLLRDESCCVRCLTNDDCAVNDGEVCDRGRCLDLLERRCAIDADCPQGLVCDGGRCASMASGTACLAQGDCASGEACYADERCRAEGAVCGECPAPSRCVAEPGDTRGTCVGCSASCDGAACPMGQACFVPDGATEGYCVDGVFCF
ncbi:MAG: hypothetical protein AAGI01_10870 [Myxococcota bacterium]